MGRKLLGGCLLVTLALVGCGGKKETPAASTPGPAASTDTAQQAAPAADPAAVAKYSACTDSVATAMAGTAEGKKKLAVTPPEGMIRPEFLAACGKPPAGWTAPVAAAAPAAPLTPKQQQVLRADSARKAREQAKADSLHQRQDMARADSTRKAQTDSVRSDSLRKVRENEVYRESFSYSGSARDPFQSLLTSARVGPELSDLQLVGIYQDLRYASNSVAVLRDKASGRRYKLRVGDSVGRLKVAQIRQYDVVFNVEDFGYERQETLSLRKREADTQ